jgi:hypothetical protein
MIRLFQNFGISGGWGGGEGEPPKTPFGTPLPRVVVLLGHSKAKAKEI